MTPAPVRPGRPALIAFAVAGLAAAAWIWNAVPAHDAGLREPGFTRAALTARARAVAKDFGVDSTGWASVVRLSRDKRPEMRLVQSNANSSHSPLARPALTAEVFLLQPPAAGRQRERVHMHLTDDGRLLDWHVENPRDEDSDSDSGDTPEAPSSSAPASQEDRPELRAVVSAAVDQLAGASASSFHAMNTAPLKLTGAAEFEAHDPSTPALNWRIHIGLKHGRLIKAELEPDVVDASFFSTFRWRLTPADLRDLGFAVWMFVAVGATWAGARAWRRGSFDRRFALLSFGLLTLATTGSWFWGTRSDEFRLAAAAGDSVTWQWCEDLLALAWAAWMLAASEAHAQRYGTSAWAPLRMFCYGRLSDAYTLRGVSCGLGAGALVAVCRIAPEWIGRHDPHWRALGQAGLSASPIADAVASFGDTAVLVVPLFALTWPWRFKSRILRVLLLLVPAVGLALMQSRTELAPSLIAWAALAGGVVSVLAYWQAGALAAALALPAAHLWLAGTGVSSPGPLIGLAGVTLVTFLAGLREAEPVADAWLPVDDTHLPSTRRERLQAEFTDAREAQRRLLPAVPPALDGYDVAALCEPATDVGGDLYDFHTLPDGRTLFSVADVSGKGMPAALYMTLSKGVLAAVCEETSNVERIASLCNRHIQATGVRGRRDRRIFVTAALAALHPESGEVELVRAGHNPPLLLRADGTVRFLKPAGLAFGMASPNLFDPRIAGERLALAPGDALVLYSDGITEAMDRDQEQYGEDRLVAALGAHGDAAALCSRIVESVREFAAGAPQHDDMTLVVLRRVR